MTENHMTQHQSCVELVTFCDCSGSISAGSHSPGEDICVLCRYQAALDAALATEQVEIVANLLEELAARSGLGAALGKALSPAIA